MEEVRKIFYQGEAYTPVFDGSRMVLMEELRTLSVEPVEDAPERLARAILITTETPKLGQWETLPAKNFDIPLDVQLVFADSGLAVATITHVESVDDTDTGPCLVATAKFFRTRLAEIIYAGVCNEILNGVCCTILWGDHIATGRAMGVVQRVEIGALENCCLPSAKIWPVQRDSSQSKKEKIGKGDIMALLPPIKRPRPIKLPDTGTGSAGLPPIKRPRPK